MTQLVLPIPFPLPRRLVEALHQVVFSIDAAEVSAINTAAASSADRDNIGTGRGLRHTRGLHAMRTSRATGKYHGTA